MIFQTVSSLQVELSFCTKYSHHFWLKFSSTSLPVHHFSFSSSALRRLHSVSSVRVYTIHFWSNWIAFPFLPLLKLTTLCIATTSCKPLFYFFHSFTLFLILCSLFHSLHLSSSFNFSLSLLLAVSILFLSFFICLICSIIYL